MRFWTTTLFLIIVAFLPLTGFAQDEPGWLFSGRFMGSSNDLGLVLKMDPAVGYRFNSKFQGSVGLPVYLVRESATTLTTTAPTTTTNPSFMNGIGNAY